MYGIVNQAIQGLVVENYGQEKWDEILKRSGIAETHFISNDSYEDEITFELVAAASEVLALKSEDVLEAFGKYWVLNTGYQKYGDLMKAGGNNFPEFMSNLPIFHGRIMLIYPKLCPPEFLVEHPEDKKIILHYYSARSGLTHFVFGLIHGIAEMFDQKIEMKLIASDSTTNWHDTFLIEIID
jgi:hypothetical protein